MKIKNTVKKSFLILFALSITLISCENFMNGALIQEELQEVIEEANAPEVEIYIAADVETGTVSPSGMVSHKIGKSFPIMFTPSANFQFLYWEVSDKNTKAELKDVLKVKESEELETRCTVLAESENIYLHPVCAERPQITSFMPDLNKTVSRDSSIIITFNKDLSKENDFSKIEISSDGVSLKDYFKTPVLNGNIITIAADKSKLINVTDTKKIIVTIPAAIYFEENGKKITSNKEYSYTYKIDNSTSIEEHIVFSVSKEKGSVTPEGDKVCNIGSSLDIKFEPKDGYNFLGWNILDGDGKAVSESLLKIEDKTAASTKITVLGNLSGVSITPISYLLPAVTSTSPKQNATGIDCDNSIVFTFNKAMKKSCFENYGNNSSVHITNKGVDVSEYYELPVLSADGKTLTLNPKLESISNIFNGSKTADIIYTINSTAKDNITGEGFNLSKDYELNVTLTTQRETVKPEFVEFRVAKTKEDVLNPQSENLLLTIPYEQMTSANYKKNLTNKIWVYCKAKDEGGKIKSIKTTETIKRYIGMDKAADDVAVVYNGNKNGYGEFSDEGNNYYETVFEYNFTAEEDGLDALTFELCDYAGNISQEKKNFDIIKDTTVSLSTLSISTGDDPVDLPIPVNNIVNYSITIKLDSNQGLDHLINDKEFEQDALRYYVYAGNSDASLNYVGEKTKNEAFTLSTNINEDLLVRVMAEDWCGNKEHKDFLIPRNNPIIGVFVDEQCESNNITQISPKSNSLMIVFATDNLSDKYNHTHFITGYYNNGEYKKAPFNREKSEWYSQSVIKDNARNGSIDYNDGNNQFTFYSHSINMVDNKYLIYGARNESSNFSLNWDGTSFSAVGTESDFYLDEAHTISVLPEDFEIVYDTITVDSDKRSVHIEPCRTLTPKEGITYLVKYTVTDNKVHYLGGIYRPYISAKYYNTMDFEIPRTETNQQNVSIIAINNAGKKIETASKVLSVTNNSGLTNPPTFSFTNYSLSYPNKLRVFAQPVAYNGAKIKNNQIDYYLINSKYIGFNKLDYANTHYSEYRKHIYNFNESDEITIGGKTYKYTDFYYDGELEQNYYIYMQIEDTAGNKYATIGDSLKSLNLDKKEPLIEYSGSKIRITSQTLNDYKYTISDKKKVYRKTLFIYEKLTGNEWIPMGLDDNIPNYGKEMDTKYDSTSKLYTSTYEVSLDSGTFAKVNVRYDSQKTDTYQYFYTTYFYPDYYTDKAQYECKLKNLLENNNKITVLCDQPAMIHTMYCSVSYDDDLKIWDTRAIESDVKMGYATFNYTVPVEKIPEGYYYTTIVHYADGDTYMTEVKQK